MRKQSARKLEQTLRQRERELAEVKKAFGKLEAQDDLDRQTTVQLRKSNRIMLDSLERILDEYERRG